MGNDVESKRSEQSLGIFSPQNRIFLFICAVTILLLCGGAFFLYSYLTENEPVGVALGQVDASGLSAEAGAKTTEAYREAMIEKDRREYEAASGREHGVSLTFAFDEDAKNQSGNEDTAIGDCDCQMSEALFLEMLTRVGGVSGGSARKDAMQVADSDIYLTTKLKLVDKSGVDLMFRSKPLMMDKDGALLDDNGVGIISSNNESLYLSNSGTILDAKARLVQLRGELVDSTGKVILGSGEYATRPGNMKRVGISDIYLTADGQMVTLDGRGVRHSGEFVFRSSESQLLNAYGAEAVWSKQAVYQNSYGHLVNITGMIFKTNGILFSYDGILIDNNGKLTQPLIEMVRIGKTDIFKNKRNFLVDANGINLKHYGLRIRLANGGKLTTTGGRPATNRRGGEIYANINGKFVSDVGGGPIQTGFLKSANKSAYNANGKKIGKGGSILRRGESDIYTTSDGFLSDAQGKSIQFNQKDTFLDFDRTLLNGSQGLITFDNNVVRNSFGEDVYLSLDGALTNDAGETIPAVGLLTDADGVLITSKGLKVVSDSSLERVTTKDGKPVTLNGKEVFRGLDGALYDADGNPLLTESGAAIFMDDNGRLVDEFGREVKNIELRAGDREIQNGELTTRKAVTTGSGEAVFYDGKKVFTDASGRLVDGNGNAITSSDGRELFLDRDGNIVDASGSIIDETLLRTRSGKPISKGLIAGREQVVTKSGGIVTFGGKAVYKGENGALIDEDGNAITDSYGNRLYIDSDGNIVNAKGEIVEDTGLRVNGEETVSADDIALRKVLTDKDGNLLTYNGESVYRGKDGRLYDANNRLIKTADGRDVYVNDNGELVDSKGERIKEELLSIKKRGALQSGELSSREALLNSDGSAVTMNGKRVYVGEGGKLYDENGKELKDDNGSQMYLSEDGTIVNDVGDITSAKGLSSNGLSERNVRDGELIKAKKLTDRNGNSLTYEGKDVFVDDQGRVVDADGNLVRDSKGNVIFYDKNTGNIVDASGSVITENILKNIDGEYVNSDIKAGPEQVISKNGGVLRIDGKEAFVSDDGYIVDADGNAILSSTGEKMYLDSKGNIVNLKGERIQNASLKLTTKNGLLRSSDSIERDVHRGELIKAKKLTDSTGKAMKYRGKDVFVDAEGRVVDSDGNVVTDSNGNVVYFDEATGNLVDISGNKIKEKLLTDSSGRLVNDNIRAGAEQILSKFGGVLTVDGKEAFISGDGSLVDLNGNNLLTPDGRKMFLDAAGNIVDRNGEIIDDAKLKIKERPSHFKQAVSKDGGILEYRGEGVFVDDDGFIVDKYGNHIRSDNGERIRFDGGDLVSESGIAISDDDFSVVRLSKVTSGIREDLQQLLTKDGELIHYNGEEVYRDKDGRLVTASGEPVLTEDGREVFVKDDGSLVDKYGKVIDEPLLTSKSGVVKSGDLTTSPVIEMRRIGNSDVFVAADGSLLDSKGRAITYNGKRVRLNENGALIDEYGNIVTDKNGIAVFMNEEGKLVDRRGRPINDSVLADGSGVLIGSNGKTVATNLTQVGGSDLYVTDGGRLVDREGRAIKFNGQDVFRGEDGRLRYGNGQLVTDDKGRSVYLNDTGALVDKNGETITGNILTDSDGVIIDSKGEMLNGGGKLTRIDGTDYYRSVNGQVVTADGKPVIMNGKAVYVDKDGRLITPSGRGIRYKGKELYLGGGNRLVTADGIGVSDKGNQLYLGDSGIVDEDGVSTSGSKKSPHGFNSSSSVPQVVKPKPTPKPKTADSSSLPSDEVGEQDNSGSNLVDVDQIAMDRFIRRFSRARAAVRNDVAYIVTQAKVAQKTIKPVGYEVALEPERSEENSAGLNDNDGDGNHESKGVIAARAGTSLYAINAYSLNSDYSNRVVADIVGRDARGDPLHGAKAMGSFERKYSKLVLKFDRLCTVGHGCISIDAIAVDVENAEVGLASDVNEHFWYRYGGLFAATILAGVSEAAGDSGTREESVSPVGSRVTTTGLEDDALIARALGRTGETFTEVLASRITRAPTAKLDSGMEMALVLFDDIVIPN